MKRKTVQMILSLTLSVAICLGAPTAAFAKDALSTEKAADEKEKIEGFKIGDIEVKNQSGLGVKSAKLQETKADNSEKKDADKNSSEKEGNSQNLVITLEDDQKHTFENVVPSEWKNPVFYNEYEIFYISYTDKNGKVQEALENVEEKELTDEVITYAKTNVNIREKADTKSKSLKVTSLGTEFKVTAVRPGWLKVEGDGVSGYVVHTYFTSNKDEIDRLVQEKKESEEKAAAQAAEAAAQASEEQAQASYSYEYDAESEGETSASSERTEVGRQAYDDCDGSGHGYYEITYSDGSVEYEEY